MTLVQTADVERVEAAGWRERCVAALAAGERFCGAFATRAAEGVEWSALFAQGTRTRVLRTGASGGVDSIVDLIPAADWDEREAHDLFEIEFGGRESLRPLVRHTTGLESWTVPVSGDGVHQVAVGPVHAGVIESGHFRFHVVGERILLVDLRLFYKHRGLERAAEGTPLADGLPFAQRACGACAVTNAVAYAQACESLQGRVPTPGLRRARTVLLELERLYNHLHDISAICAGVGFAPGNMTFAALKERVMRMNLELGGHRFLFGTVRVGGSEIAVAQPQLERVREALRELSRDAAASWRELEFATSFQARLGGVGVLGADDARRLGAVGPAARAAGIREDTRTASPGLAYEPSMTVASLEDATGDVASRLRIRAVELEQTFELLDAHLSEPLEPAEAPAGRPPAPIGVARVESPRGESVCVLEAEGARVRRLHLRTGSYANWPSLAHSTTGELLPDFPLINKSFELCYACADR